MKYEYDVFLSHNSENKPWVREFYGFLRSHGLNVFIDEESIKFGENLADSIEKGIEKSKHVLLVISTHSLASPWVALEEAISNYVDVDASDRKVIPLLLENVEDKIKPRIRRLNMVNLVDHTKREHQIRKLLLELNIENTQTIQIPDRVLALGKSCLDVEPIPFSMNSHIEMIKEEQNIEARFNIAVLGKTGVGKSTLINYLFGADVRKAGVGTPITQRGFHREDLVIQGIPATLFDSEGLEVGNSERWLDSLKQELNLRSAKMPSQEWFHTVIYCVASSSARIEEFELRILNEFIDSKYKIIVAMTKSDITAQEDIDDLEKAILSGLNSQVSCVAVSSERKKLRTGTTERFGAEEIYKCIHSTFWDAISYRLPERCISILKGIVDAWIDSQKELINQNIQYFGRNIDTVIHSLTEESERFYKDLISSEVDSIIKEEIRNVIATYAKFSSLIDFQTQRRRYEPQGDSKIKVSEYLSRNLLSSYASGVASGATIGFAASVASASIFYSVIFTSLIPLIPIAIGGQLAKVRTQKKNIIESIDDFGDSLKSQIEKLEPEISSIIRRMLVQEGSGKQV